MTRSILVTGGSGFIGACFVQRAMQRGYRVHSLDLAPPRPFAVPDQFINLDIRNQAETIEAVAAVNPDIIVHLASDVSLNITSLEGYSTTLQGTRNLIAAAARLDGLQTFIHTSTQFVVRPGVEPRNDTWLEPYTLYGEAKAETERMFRGASLKGRRVIVRPTVIWGPHHPSFAQHIFKHIARRTYLHPVARQPILRAFGYVENTAMQLLTAVERTDLADLSVLYLGDEVLDYARWADAFAIALTGRPARKLPVPLLLALGSAGDLVKRVGLPSPIDSGRAFRMTTSSAISLDPILALAGPLPVSFEQGVRRTVQWLRSEPGFPRAT